MREKVYVGDGDVVYQGVQSGDRAADVERPAIVGVRNSSPEPARSHRSRPGVVRSRERSPGPSEVRLPACADGSGRSLVGALLDNGADGPDTGISPLESRPCRPARRIDRRLNHSRDISPVARRIGSHIDRGRGSVMTMHGED